MNLNKILISERIDQAKKGFRESFSNYMKNFSSAIKTMNEKEMKKKLREMKEYSIKNLEKLKDEAKKNLEVQGIKVFEAKDAKDARKIIKKIIPKGEIVAKAK
ncbi:MAG: LUD domain-containing protein, partial [Candidatus Aenigmatarchaeota archaeon]